MEKFGREVASLELFKELEPLFLAHHGSVSNFPDQPLNPQYDKFLHLEAAGALRLFVARGERGQALGYCAFAFCHSLQRAQILEANQIVLFIDPEARGFGGRFIDWCDEQLFGEGADVVYHHVKAKPDQNFSPMLERKNYELCELVWMKRRAA